MQLTSLLLTLMMTVEISLATLLFIAASAVFMYVLFGRRASGLPPLPGPKGYPFIGTILPLEDPLLKMTEYSKQFGASAFVFLGDSESQTGM